MVATVIAIVVLIATVMAAIALMRSVDTSNTIAGSMTFRQAAMQESERAYQDAQTNLFQNTNFTITYTQSDNTGVGYYAELQPLDTATGMPAKLLPTAIAASQSGIVALPAVAGGTGNRVFYILERLCPTSGAALTTTCVEPSASNTGGSLANQGGDTVPPVTTAAYRLSVTVLGQRNAVAYMQTIVR